MPSADAMAMRLDVFVSPPNMSISTFPDKLPKPNSRFELASRHRRNPAIDWTEIPPKESSEICLYASGGKVNCYQRGRGRFWSSCDISATKLEPELASCEMLETDEKTKLIKMLNGYRRPPAGFLRRPRRAA
jgi:hypothetical protein